METVEDIIKMKVEKEAKKTCGGVNGTDATVADAVALSHQARRRSSNAAKPSWLLLSIADMDDRMKMLAVNIPEGGSDDSFANRAEAYYQKRPQLLALVQDLFNGYLSLADRYCHSLAKGHHRRQSSPVLNVHFNNQLDEEEACSGDIDSDVESSLSYQPPFLAPTQSKFDIDMMVAELVIKNVDYEIVLNELNAVGSRWGESSRKIELQKSLLEVLESERLILLNENAKLGYKVNALVEENKGLAAESLFMKRKAGELARCVLQQREDHRVCMLSRKIEDLQGQIYGLEKRNKEYYAQLIKHEEATTSKTKKKKKNGGEVTLEACFHGNEDAASASTSSVGSFASGVKGRLCDNGEGGGSGRKASRFWDRIKNFDMFLCGPQYNPTGC